MGLVDTEDIQSKQNDGSGVQKSCNTENDCHVQLRASCMHGCLLNRSLQHMSSNCMGNVWWELTFVCHGEKTIAPRGA